MADIEKAINDLEEIKSKLIPAISRMYGSGFSSVFACEKVEEKIDNAVELLKAQNGLAKALEQMTATNDYLNKEVERLETELPKWIPVTDRLPQDDEDVLVWVNGTHRDMAYRDEGVWYDEEHNHLKNITHWMPLPKPPKKDGEQE